jgi:hypothetical protein
MLLESPPAPVVRPAGLLADFQRRTSGLGEAADTFPIVSAPAAVSRLRRRQAKGAFK